MVKTWLQVEIEIEGKWSEEMKVQRRRINGTGRGTCSKMKEVEGGRERCMEGGKNKWWEGGKIIGIGK
jgi:hypothetical protein